MGLAVKGWATFVLVNQRLACLYLPNQGIPTTLKLHQFNGFPPPVLQLRLWYNPAACFNHLSCVSGRTAVFWRLICIV
jgi:hypothetical protein